MTEEKEVKVDLEAARQKELDRQDFIFKKLINRMTPLFENKQWEDRVVKYNTPKIMQLMTVYTNILMIQELRKITGKREIKGEEEVPVKKRGK